jgi:hypothetical protein
MSPDDLKKRFAEEVKLRAFNDNYIDKNEEREILQIALQRGMDVDDGRAALIQVCEANGYILESHVLKQAKNLLETLADNDGEIDEKEFNDAVVFTRKAVQGKRSNVQIKRLLIDLIEDHVYKTSKGWFSSWYANVKKEVGK